MAENGAVEIGPHSSTWQSGVSPASFLQLGKRAPLDHRGIATSYDCAASNPFARRQQSGNALLRIYGHGHGTTPGRARTKQLLTVHHRRVGLWRDPGNSSYPATGPLKNLLTYMMGRAAPRRPLFNLRTRMSRVATMLNSHHKRGRKSTPPEWFASLERTTTFR